MPFIVKWSFSLFHFQGWCDRYTEGICGRGGSGAGTEHAIRVPLQRRRKRYEVKQSYFIIIVYVYFSTTCFYLNSSQLTD